MNLKIIWQLIQKEALLVLNDKSIFLVLFAAPIFYFFLMGSTYVKKDEENVSVGVVDLDHSQSSRAFLNKLNATQKVNLSHTYTNALEAKNGLSRFDVQGYINIPNGFEKKLRSKAPSPIGLVLNNTRFLPSNDINKAVNLVALDYAQDSRKAFFKSKNIAPELAEDYADPVSIAVHAVYNANNNYGDFLLPFILFLILHQMLFIGLAESAASDHEQKAIKRDFQTSKHNVLNYIIGKTSLYFILFMAYILLVFLVVFPILDLPIQGNLFQLIGVTTLFLTATILYSWFFASFFTSQLRAMEVVALTSYPIFLITGITWPINQMPLFVQYIANLIPLKPFFVILKKLALMGTETSFFYTDIIQLFGLLLGAYLLVYFRCRYLQKTIADDTAKPVPILENSPN
ncbi:ABC transporter permease [Algibacter pacificus]|uniref:ABC transporter permease n=1 Tax=Algibacter pacificus TaxID=2599389 RepID=UPI0011C7BE36|nr:ABC transporter permease [Algibacter pacificus]